jgi:hypothetical protein
MHRLTVTEIAEYCKNCYYYRGVTPFKRQCYYRVWEEERIKAPSLILRAKGTCEYARKPTGYR